MRSNNSGAKAKTSALVIVLYVIAAILAAIFCWSLYMGIVYINNYMASYGMSFADMAGDGVQYVMNQSLSYLIYALLIFAAAKGLKLLQNMAVSGAAGATASDRTASGSAEVADLPEAERRIMVKREIEDILAETAQAASTDLEPAERAEQFAAVKAERAEGSDESEFLHGAEPVESMDNDIPESEDAVEETTVIESGDGLQQDDLQQDNSQQSASQSDSSQSDDPQSEDPEETDREEDDPQETKSTELTESGKGKVPELFI